MSEITSNPKTKGSSEVALEDSVLQVERRDYPDLAPTDRPRSQSLEGFDDVYTDIVEHERFVLTYDMWIDGRHISTSLQTTTLCVILSGPTPTQPGP